MHRKFFIIGGRLAVTFTIAIPAVSLSFTSPINSTDIQSNLQSAFTSNTQGLQSITCPAVTEIPIPKTSTPTMNTTSSLTYQPISTNNACLSQLSASGGTPTYSFKSANIATASERGYKIICTYTATSGSSTCPLAYEAAVASAPVTPSIWSHYHCHLKTRIQICTARNFLNCLFKVTELTTQKTKTSIENKYDSDEITPSPGTHSIGRRDYCAEISEDYTSEENTSHTRTDTPPTATGNNIAQIRQNYSSSATSCPIFTSNNYSANEVTQFSGFSAIYPTPCSSSKLPVLNNCTMTGRTPSQINCFYANDDQCVFTYESNTPVIPTGQHWSWKQDRVEAVRCFQSINDCAMFLSNN